ncbi:MAG TPA: MinD/ParA family protein [Nocardioidaceae bacterium]|nr:MinD/ParA family protein [Nocardioidaceae bacterium]
MSRPEPRWHLPAGLDRLGLVQGSGLLTPTYLVRRSDGQVVQLSELLHLVLDEVDRDTTVDEAAESVSRAYGKTLTGEGFAYLVESKLQPLGLVEDETVQQVSAPPRARPVLSLALRGTILPAPVVQTLARWAAPAYTPWVVATALVLLAALDLALFARGSLVGALEQVLATPALLLGLYVLMAASALVHEVGHAAACWYGGARPGEIGFGVYLVFPAFYTDVTASYALDRRGRLRTDLGGLYFNVGCLLVLGTGYLLTGNGLLLLVVLLLHLEMLQQLLPTVRFDGYYVLADLAGIPDLFGRVVPVLRNLVPGTPTDPRVAEMRPASRRLVVGWVLLVVPVLALSLVWLLWHLPAIVATTLTALEAHATALTEAWSAGEGATVVLSALSVVLVTLPLAGIAVLLWRLGTVLARPVLRRLPRVRLEEVTMTADTDRPDTDRPDTDRPHTDRPDLVHQFEEHELTAAAFTDEAMLPPPAAAPRTGWRRAVFEMSGRTLNPGPGPQDQRRAALERRLRTPIKGSRRVVVMSRKGGVGKTTITLALGSVFSTLRGDRVVAVDANPDAGNLAHRVAPMNDLTITDVLAELDGIVSYAQLRAYTSQAPESRLEVLASDNDPRIGMALDREDYHRLIGLLDRFYNLILLDTGTGILDSANQGLIREAGELVLVLRPGLDGGRAAALTLDWLGEHGYDDLVTRAVVVVNGVREGVGAPLDPMVRHFEQRCRRVVTVPWDPNLEAGAQTSLSSLRRATRESLIEVAAALADGFVTSEVRR